MLLVDREIKRNMKIQLLHSLKLPLSLQCLIVSYGLVLSTQVKTALTIHVHVHVYVGFGDVIRGSSHLSSNVYLNV